MTSTLPAAPASFVALLRARAQAQPDAIAYTWLGEGVEPVATLTYGELDRRARVLAGGLQARGMAGERVLLLYPPGLEYVAAFWGCLYAGAIAVPTQPPMRAKGWGRIAAILADARPQLVLLPADMAARLQEVPRGDSLAWEVDEVLTAGDPEAWTDPRLTAQSLAFLQYTSGSTSVPKGVMVSHGNLLHNLGTIQAAWSLDARDVIVSWLPLFHDMGLIGNMLFAVYLGATAYLMSPLDFLRRPVRWLEAISRYRATYSGGPNFAYDLCLKRLTGEERAALSLASWRVAYNGAEPVRTDTLDRLVETLGPCGLRPAALKPVYGLAEATVFVTGPDLEAPPHRLAVCKEALAAHRVQIPAPGAGQLMVGCGHAWLDQRVLIVDPDTHHGCPPEQVGEIWIGGPSVAQGYWNREDVTRETFQATLAGSGAGPFLRTGDLGFIRDGQLVVTGRLKDLIILRGRNLYPQDLERVAEESHGSLRPGCSAVFTIEVEGEERPVLVIEVERRQVERSEPTEGNREAMLEQLARFSAAPKPLLAREVAGAIQVAVHEAFEVPLYEVVLIKATTLPKTTSGKVQRRACRSMYLAGGLERVEEAAWD